jgi:hypothetical protein
VDFVEDEENLRHQLVEIERERRRCRRQIAALEGRLTHLTARVTELRLQLALGPSEATQEVLQHLPHLEYADDLQRGHLGEACDVALRRAGRPLRVTDLVEMLEFAGRGMGKNGYRTVYVTLQRDDRFEKVGPGRFRRRTLVAKEGAEQPFGA